MNEIDLLEQQAVEATVAKYWDEAVKLNKKILKLDKANIGAQLRLGFIYLQQDDYEAAKKHYKAALRIQPANQLAHDNLERIEILEGSEGKQTINKNINFNPNFFLEIPGKTKSVVLVNVGQKNILAGLTTGEQVFLKPKKPRIELRTHDNEYVGSIPDDLSKRLFHFLKAGSEYRAFIKEVSLSKVVIFIREEKRAKRLIKYSSFPKNAQSNLSIIASNDTPPGGSDDSSGDSESDDSVDSDLDTLAEKLTSEDKEYIQIESDDSDEENIEE